MNLQTNGEVKNKISLTSRIFKLFSFDMILELYRIAMDISIDNNGKRDEIIEVLNKYGIEHERIGPGTNRYTALIDGYIVKFCLDTDGMIDNLREFKYSMILQPYVLMVYEVLPDGLLMVCEYMELMTRDDFNEPDVRGEMRKILGTIATQYFIGDVGLDSKNYTNWGFRKNTNRDLVILDFAYCYSLSFKSFMCHCSNNAMLYYNDNYTGLICPKCKKSYDFSDIRRTISRDDQRREIGDVRKIGYVLHSERELHDFDSNKSWRPEEEKKKRKNPFKSFKSEELPDYNKQDVFDEEEETIDDDLMWDDISENLPF